MINFKQLTSSLALIVAFNSSYAIADNGITDSADLYDFIQGHGLSGGGTGGSGVEGEQPPISLEWEDIQSKPYTATRWPQWGEVTAKPSLFPTDWSMIDNKPEEIDIVIDVFGKSCPDGKWMKGINSSGNLVCAEVPVSDGDGGDGGDGEQGGEGNEPNESSGGPHGNDGSTYEASYAIGYGCNRNTVPYSAPEGGTLLGNFTSSGQYSLTVEEEAKDKVFTIILKGGGGGADDKWDESCGGNGGGIIFNYTPMVTGTFDIIVGGGGRYGPYAAFGGGAIGRSGGGGGASAIKFNDQILAIVGGGGGGGNDGHEGADGGAYNLGGAYNESVSFSGRGGINGIGGDGGGGKEQGYGGGSFGGDGQSGSYRGKGIVDFMISGGGSSEEGGGGGGGYGGGGGGGGKRARSSASGGGGGGYYNSSIPSTPMIIRGGRGANGKGNGESGSVIIFTDTMDW